MPIRLPALRERPEDVPLLAGHVLARVIAAHGKRFEGFSDDALLRLQQHRWPGNIRELENVVERAAALARGPQITAADLALDFESPGTRARPTLDELERRYIDQVLAETNGDKRRAARVLGVSVRTLQRLFKARATPSDEPGTG
jgi:two-component system response regulator HydG